MLGLEVAGEIVELSKLRLSLGQAIQKWTLVELGFLRFGGFLLSSSSTAELS